MQVHENRCIKRAGVAGYERALDVISEIMPTRQVSINCKINLASNEYIFNFLSLLSIYMCPLIRGFYKVFNVYITFLIDNG